MTDVSTQSTQRQQPLEAPKDPSDTVSLGTISEREKIIILITEGNNLVLKEQYEEAYALTKDLYPRIKKVLGDSVEFLELLKQSVNVESHLGLIEREEQTRLEIVALSQKISTPESYECYNAYNDLIDFYLRNNDPKKAQSTGLKMQESMAKIYGVGSLQQAGAWKKLANTCVVTGATGRAENAYTKAINICEGQLLTARETAELALIELYEDRSMLHRDSDEYQDALILDCKALGYAIKHESPQEILCASAKVNIARDLNGLGNYAEAKTYATEALTYFEENNLIGFVLQAKRALAVSVTNEGAPKFTPDKVLKGIAILDEVEELISQNEELEAELKSTFVQRALLYRVLSEELGTHEHKESAASDLRAALEISDNENEPDSEDLVGEIEALAELEQELGHYEAAQELIERVSAMRERLGLDPLE